MNKLATFALLITASSVLSGCIAPGPYNTAQPSIKLPDVEAVKITYMSNGACTVSYKMTNNYDFTYAMGGQVFMTDAAGNTLGEGSASFPPTLPNKSSQADVMFHNFNLAGNSCIPGRQLIFRGRFCKNVASGNYLRDYLCESIVANSSITIKD